MIMERRHFRRYDTGLQTVEAVVNDSLKRFFIKDISRGGVMFEYTPLADDSVETESIDIIAMDCDGVKLRGIRCETVYDILTLPCGRSFTGGTLRLRGLKFLELTKKQDHNLIKLLECCRNSPISD